jgi:hypothetical protein
VREHQCFATKVAKGCARLCKVAQPCATLRNSDSRKVAGSCQFRENGILGCSIQHSEGPGMVWKSFITNFGTDLKHPAEHPF